MSEKEQHQSTPRGLNARNLAKLRAFSQHQQLEENELVPYFERRIQEGANIRQLSTLVGLPPATMGRFLRMKNVSLPLQAEVARRTLEINRQDPEFRTKQAEASAQAVHEKWQDQEFRARQAATIARSNHKRWQDPEYRRKMSEATTQRNHELWQDPEFRIRQAEATARSNHERWQDPKFRARMVEIRRQDLLKRWLDPEFRVIATEAGRAGLIRKWQDPEFRARRAQDSTRALRERWQDLNYRAKMVEVARKTRMNPQYADRWVVPTIHGHRWDIGFTQSTWEANLARVLKFVGREVVVREPLRLSDDTIFELDFLTLDNRGNLVGYEIMAHPLEIPDGWDKLEKVISEYSEISFRIVDEKFYRRLTRSFAARINLDSTFAGWENKQDNLRNNPNKYAPKATGI